ncbi:MAG: PAS domain S-box protein [Acidobacteria bacterium]|nr:PAS domain S-box protein [Acidobacteriota bacterium]
MARTLEVLDSLERASTLFVELETGTRGYVVTGQDGYLGPYFDARRSLPGELKRLRELTADNPNQQRRLSALENLAAGRGKEGMDAIRKLIGEMRTEEHRLLQQRRAAAAAMERELPWAIMAFAGLIVAILIGAYFQVRQHLMERLRAEKALALQVRIAAIFLTVPDDETFNEVLKVILDVMHSPFGVFGYLDEAGALVVPTMTRQIWDKCQVSEKTIRFPRETWGDSSWPRAIREKRAIFSNEPSTVVPEGHGGVHRHNSLPIELQGEVIGLFQVANKKTDYTEADIRTLESIARNVAPILNARLQHKRAEDALRESEENLAITLHSIVEGVLSTDCDGRVERMNPMAERLTGWSEAEARGRPVDQVFRTIDEHTRQPTTIPLEKALTTGLVGHTVLVARDGAERPIAESAAPIRCRDGRPLGVVLVFRDVTPERQAEEAARIGRERYRQVTELAPHALFIRSESRFAYVNPAGLAMLGAGRTEEIVGKPVLDFVHPDSRDVLAERLRRVDTERICAPPLEARFLRLDGSAFWGEWTASPVTHEGKPGAVVVLQDISRRKDAEMAAAEHEAQLRVLSENLPGGAVFQTVREGDVRRYAYISSGIEALTGLRVEEILARPGLLASLEFPEDTAETESAVRRSAEEMTPIDREMRIRTASGEDRWLHWRSAPRRRSDGGIQWDGVVLDVTSRKQAEDELRRLNEELEGRVRRRAADLAASHARLSEAQSFARLGDWDLDVRANRLTWSRQVYCIFGLSPESHVPSQDDFRARIHPGDVARFDEAGSTLSGSRGPVDVEYRILLPGGDIRWVTSRTFLEADESGQPVRLYGTVQDASDRVRAREELRASEEKFRRIVETATEGIWTLDADHRTTYVNRQMAAMLGWSVEEMLGKSPFDFLDEEGRRVAAQKLERRRQGVAERFDLRFQTREGKDCWTILSAAPLYGPDGKYAGALAMITDITERKHLEDQYRQAQKMESIGRLAGGVAHDFNNLLTVISGYTEMLLDQVEAGSPVHQSLTQVRKAGDRAADLTQQLLVFSRKQIIHPKVLDLNSVVSDVEKILRRVIGENIDLKTSPGAELGRVLADAGQITQVLMNLAVNARDAMPDGGTLIIETANVALGEAYTKEHPEVTPGSYVQLTVSDSGIGMEQATKQRIFEPFFTTKKAGEGTGLGLATVYGIVKRAGGWIWVYSEPGHGATFKVYLPRVEGPVTVEEAQPGAVSLEGTETVLVVEDEAELREFARLVLTKRGYNVLGAANAEEALLLCESNSGPIHLLLTDVIMPGMNGRQLAERLHPLRPEMKVLYMSGYTDSAIVHHGILDDGVLFLQKPFGAGPLAAKVREALGPPRPAATILVVDDEPGIRSLLRQVLAREGYQVLEAEDGKQAMERAAGSHLDLVITDLVMPEQEGLETIGKLRKQQPDLKIVAISGAFEGEFLKVAAMLGAQATLAKPVSPRQLLETVRKVLSGAV